MIGRFHDVIVVGAGLSGLACAHRLAQNGLSVCVLEAHKYAGGRIRSVRDELSGEWLGDLGPTWVWPDYQPDLKHWLDEMGLSSFGQYSQGETLVDSRSDEQAISQFIPDSSGYYRICGGTGEIIQRLLNQMVDVDVQLGRTVTHINLESEHCEVFVDSDDTKLVGRAVVIATPPRIAAQLSWQPVLSDQVQSALKATATWMARQAKVVLLYERAFWRDLGLSGRVVSRIGPLTELHDHCGSSGDPASLTGFIGLDHRSRQEAGSELSTMILHQLSRIFGPEAPKPLQIIVRDWSTDPRITTESDLHGLAEHPMLCPDLLRQSHYNRRVWFASAETADTSPGLIAGAVTGAQQISSQIVEHLQSDNDEYGPTQA